MGFGSPTPNETTDNGPRACTARAVVGVEDGGEAVVMAPLAVTPEGATFGVASLYQVCITGERVAPASWHRDRRRLSIFHNLWVLEDYRDGLGISSGRRPHFVYVHIVCVYYQ